MFGAVTKEIHKMFASGDRHFKPIGYAHNAPGYLSVSDKIQILQLQTDSNKAERRVFGQTISQRIEDYPDFLDFIFFQ